MRSHPRRRNRTERFVVVVVMFLFAGWCLVDSVLLGRGFVPVALVGSNDASLTTDRVKFYEVLPAYDGRPENLSEIALRFLGNAARADEIFALNVARVQPDGGQLTEPVSLTAGWLLILPWDAFGDGVEYGVLPTATQPSPTPAAGMPLCGNLQNSAIDAGAWAQQRMAAQRVWDQSRGKGVVVAVVDSGVDGSLPELAGRVSLGADIVSGTGRGNTDCLGTGTAMAGLIAARDAGDLPGVAPGATILPIRVVTDKPSATVADQVTAIEVAVSAGARVIAIGSFVDINAPQVRQALENAGRHDVVLVAGAAPAGDRPLPTQVIRVGAVNSDGEVAEPYPHGSLDVLAPGVDVTSLGPAGTGRFRGSGTQYAVALVAGAVALVRAADPAMRSDAVVRLINTTARPVVSGPVPDPGTGWGLVDLSRTLQHIGHTPGASADPGRTPAARGERRSRRSPCWPWRSLACCCSAGGAGHAPPAELGRRPWSPAW